SDPMYLIEAFILSSSEGTSIQCWAACEPNRPFHHETALCVYVTAGGVLPDQGNAEIGCYFIVIIQVDVAVAYRPSDASLGKQPAVRLPTDTGLDCIAHIGTLHGGVEIATWVMKQGIICKPARVVQAL